MEPRLRTAFVAHSSVAGGAEAFAVRLYSGLRERGIDGTLFGQLPGWENTGLPSVVLPLGGKWSRRAVVASARRAGRERRATLQAVLDAHLREPFAVAHAQYKREQILLTRAFARRLPVLWTEHGALPEGGLLATAQARAYARASRRVSLVAPVSAHVLRSLQATPGFGPGASLVIPNAIDTDRFSISGRQEREAARRALGLGADTRPVVAWIGRLDPGKRPELACAVAPLLPGGHVLIAGDGAQRDALSRLAVDLSVTLLGFRPPEAVLAAADVFLFTSNGASEGLPTTLLEAAACGLPIVATSDCGMSEIVIEAGGTVVPPDPARIAAAVTAVAGSVPPAARSWADAHALDGFLDAYAGAIRRLARRQQRYAPLR